jgi:hypothetical protein
MANQRFTPGANQDNTGRVITYDLQTPAFASTIAIATTYQNTSVQVGLLTGACKVTIATANAQIGDSCSLYFTSTAGETVTFGAGFLVSAATLVVAATGTGYFRAVFNGTYWAETDRSLAATVGS